MKDKDISLLKASGDTLALLALVTLTTSTATKTTTDRHQRKIIDHNILTQDKTTSPAGICTSLLITLATMTPWKALNICTSHLQEDISEERGSRWHPGTIFSPDEYPVEI